MIDSLELNEDFAAQSLFVYRYLGIPKENANLFGEVTAPGFRFRSGARLMVTPFMR